MVTVTSTVPDPAGATAVIVVALLTVNVADAAPKCTAVAPVKPVPSSVTRLPAGPASGSMAASVGTGGGGGT